MKDVTFSRDAVKTLRRIPRNVAELIVEKIEQYASHPESLANNVKMLRGGENLMRLRVGDWRIVVTEDGQVIAVSRIASRGRAYD